MSRRKRWTLGATGPVGKGSQLALLFWGLLGIASVLLVFSGSMVSFNANASNPDNRSGGQTRRKAPPGTVWIPEGTFLMGTNDKESFANERPAHLVQVRGFWMDEHDVTNAEFSRFVEATGYVTTADRQIDWEELKKEVPPGTPKPDDSALAAGALVFTPSARPVPLNDLSAWRGTPPDTGSSHTGFRCVISRDNTEVTRSVGIRTSLANRPLPRQKSQNKKTKTNEI
jgi:hypothetical protein